MLGSVRNNLREVFNEDRHLYNNNAKPEVIITKTKDHSPAHSSTCLNSW